MEDDVGPAADLRTVGDGDLGERSAGQDNPRGSGRSGRKQIRRVFEQCDLVIGVECLAQIAVHEHGFAADREHTPRKPLRVLVIGIQKRDVALAGGCPHSVFDLVAGDLGER